jgi:hypothetical protein
MPQGPFQTAIARAALGAGAWTAAQLAGSGQLVQGNLHGQKFINTNSGATFSGANQTGATLSAALATTYTGLVLSNPAANTVNLAVGRIAGGIGVAPAAALALGLIVGYAAAGITVHTTPLAPLNQKLNGALPTAKLDAAATLVGTPAWSQWIAINTAVTAGYSFSLDMQGGLIIPPGGYVAIGGNVAGPTLGLFASIEWEEVTI